MSSYLLDGEFESKARVSAYTSCSTLSSLPGCDRDMVTDLEGDRVGTAPTTTARTVAELVEVWLQSVGIDQDTLQIHFL